MMCVITPRRHTGGVELGVLSYRWAGERRFSNACVNCVGSLKIYPAPVE